MKFVIMCVGGMRGIMEVILLQLTLFLWHLVLLGSGSVCDITLVCGGFLLILYGIVGLDL
jgi:hypothetical protein